MQHWEYNFIYADISREGKKNNKGEISTSGYPDPGVLWNTLADESVFQKITKMGQSGWEMVSATPIEEGAHNWTYTKYILFCFKRKVVD